MDKLQLFEGTLKKRSEQLEKKMNPVLQDPVAPSPFSVISSAPLQCDEIGSSIGGMEKAKEAVCFLALLFLFSTTEKKKKLMEAIVWPSSFPELFLQSKIQTPRSVLLFGPPGTGKTALINQLGFSFFFFLFFFDRGSDLD